MEPRRKYGGQKIKHFVIGVNKMIFTRDILDNYCKSLSKFVFSLPDTIVALFSVVQQQPDMHPYWMAPGRYKDSFYDFWLFMYCIYKENKETFYLLVKDLSPLSDKMWDEFIDERTINDLLQFHHTDFATFLSVLLWAYNDKRKNCDFLNCKNLKTFMDLLLTRYRKYKKVNKSVLYLDDKSNKLYLDDISNKLFLNNTGYPPNPTEISQIIDRYT